MKSFFALLAFIFCTSVIADTYHANQKIDDLFLKANVEGTFIVFNVNKSSFIAHNSLRANKRYIPASTFKIANSLIGLSVGAVKNVDDVLPYGGKPQRFKSWEKDMGLRDAIKISNVPIYKELAHRIGLERMKANVQKMNYGNNQIGSTVDSFWLEGPLEISAFEQTQFLSQLAQKKLPFSNEIQESVRDIIKLDEGEGWVLYGKTGWSNNIGWWVGWVEKQDNIYSFALNMDMTDINDAPKRIELSKASLKILGIID